jgi:hypothetical protein
LKFKKQSEELLLSLMEANFSGKELDELLGKQEFLNEFTTDFEKCRA